MGGLSTRSNVVADDTVTNISKHNANKSGIIGPTRFDRYYNDYVAKKKKEKELAKSMLKEKGNLSAGTSSFKRPTTAATSRRK